MVDARACGAGKKASQQNVVIMAVAQEIRPRKKPKGGTDGADRAQEPQL